MGNGQLTQAAQVAWHANEQHKTTAIHGRGCQLWGYGKEDMDWMKISCIASTASFALEDFKMFYDARFVPTCFHTNAWIWLCHCCHCSKHMSKLLYIRRDACLKGLFCLLSCCDTGRCRIRLISGFLYNLATMAPIWTVVGGEQTGGIVVRAGVSWMHVKHCQALCFCSSVVACCWLVGCFWVGAVFAWVLVVRLLSCLNKLVWLLAWHFVFVCLINSLLWLCLLLSLFVLLLLLLSLWLSWL